MISRVAIDRVRELAANPNPTYEQALAAEVLEIRELAFRLADAVIVLDGHSITLELWKSCQVRTRDLNRASKLAHKVWRK